jgi:F-type H+-transporting ATPase subunit delta
MLFAETAFIPYISELSGNTIKAAVHNGRLAILPMLPAAFLNIYEKRSGIAKVLLETAHEPADGLLEIVTERMRRRTGKAVKLEHTVNPELLGGLKVWYEGRLIDNSAEGRLTRLRRLLTDSFAR